MRDSSLPNTQPSFSLPPHPELLRLLAARFYNSCEDYYPPQILETLELFAEIGYSDDNVVGGFVGRLEDLVRGIQIK
jgi:hypothetical protein